MMASEIGTKAAFAQAQSSRREGGIPIGASLMINTAVVSLGHNRRIQKTRNSLHGETDRLRRAGQTFDQTTVTMFSTLFPCLMCTGGILLYKIPKVVILEDEKIVDFETGLKILKKEGVEVILHPDPRILDMKKAPERR